MSEKATAMIGDDVSFNSVTATVNTGTVVKNNYTATSDPVVTSDAANGYSVGSEWINTSAETFWVCFDTTNGAAVWTQMAGVATSSGTGGAFTVASPQIMVISAVTALVFEDSEFVVENYTTA